MTAALELKASSSTPSATEDATNDDLPIVVQATGEPSVGFDYKDRAPLDVGCAFYSACDFD